MAATRRAPFLTILGCAVMTGGLVGARAQAAPMRVAVIGAQMVHSDKLQRSQEWPAMLQKLVGADYDVQNFGDCCSSVSLDYPKQPETHPYLRPPNNAAFKPGYNESVAFMPDIVIIGPWGKHDRELTTEVFGGKLDPVKFAADYETMIMTYENLPTHPKLFASLPIPIPFGMASGVVNDVILPATKMVLAKHPEIAVVDLWAPFVGHKELFNQDTGARAGTHVTPDAGLHKIADTVYAVWQQRMNGGTPDDASPELADAGPLPVDAAAEEVATPAGGPADAAGGSGGHAGGAGGGAGESGSSDPGGTGGSTTDTPTMHASRGCAYGGDGGGGWAWILLLGMATLPRRRNGSRSTRGS
jgi:hypothetical protein